MKQLTRDGFVLILGIVAIALAGAAVLVLTGLASALLFDANQAYLEAYNRNLTASALVWAQHNRDELNDSSKTEQIQLDISHLNIPDGDLRITPLEPRKRTTRIQINTECRREAMKLKRSDVYLITSR